MGSEKTRAASAGPGGEARRAAAGGEKRLGRGLEDFSHLFFSAAEERRAAEARTAPAPAPAPAPRREPEAATWGRPRTVFVTGFRRGCGKTLLASAIAQGCRRAAASSAEWQLGPGVVVPRRGQSFDRPLAHPSDRAAFDQLVASAGPPAVLVLDGPAALLGDGDPFALAVEEFLVLALPGREGAAEGYAAVKEIVGARPDAAIRVVVNRASSQGEAREVFHRIADVAERHLGRTVRSFGGLPTLSPSEVQAIAEGREGRALLFSRIARALAVESPEESARPSYFEEVWARFGLGGG
jgi:hypothetical protein